MGRGGTLRSWSELPPARLLTAYTGITRYEQSRWNMCRWDDWILDYLHQGRQLQRVGSRPPFRRASGAAALYLPGTVYREQMEAGAWVDESYVVFAATGQVEQQLRRVAGDEGVCYWQDDNEEIGSRLRRIGEALFRRRPGFRLRAQGLFLELLGLLIAAGPGGRLPVATTGDHAAAGRLALARRTENYVRAHIADPIRVATLAAHARMSLSAFAHTYSREVGETPYTTVCRLKIETAKQLILQEKLPLKEVADRLGFSSEFHLSRLFKRVEGVSPRDYRHALDRRA